MAYQDPILFSSLLSQNSYLYMCHVGRDRCKPRYCYGPVVRSFYLIHLIVSGKGSYVARNTTYHLSANQAFIIYPNETTLYAADAETPWDYCFFAFNGDYARELIERTGFRGGNMVITIPPEIAVPLAEQIEATARTLNRLSPNADLYALSQLVSFFAILADSHSDNIQPDALTRDFVRRAVGYIHFNYANPITIMELSKTLNINRSYLYRIFKEEIGLSPSEYLNNYRIDRARHLLIESDMPISQIAMSTGFSTFSSFYRLFRLKYNMSARQYRARYSREIKTDENARDDPARS
jgi:AraC-like DNA-binding protein